MIIHINLTHNAFHVFKWWIWDFNHVNVKSIKCYIWPCWLTWYLYYKLNRFLPLILVHPAPPLYHRHIMDKHPTCDLAPVTINSHGKLIIFIMAASVFVFRFITLLPRSVMGVSCLHASSRNLRRRWFINKDQVCVILITESVTTRAINICSLELNIIFLCVLFMLHLW